MSRYDPEKHHRRSIRLRGYDYRGPGAYFITIVTQERLCLFGEVVRGTMHLNAFGEIVRTEWLKTAELRPYVRLDEREFVVMPNHVHGIMWIVDDMRATRDDVGVTRDDDVGTTRDDDGDHGDVDVDVGMTRDDDDDVDDVGAQRRCAPTPTPPTPSMRLMSPPTPLILPPTPPTPPTRLMSPPTPPTSSMPNVIPGSIGAIVRAFKSATTKRINQLRNMPGAPVWQRNYYEHIIRDEVALRRIRDYIQANPRRWTLDRERS